MRSFAALVFFALSFAVVSGDADVVAPSAVTSALRGKEAEQALLPAVTAAEVASPAAALEAAADTRNEYEKTNIEAEVLAALFFAASLLICVLECCPPGKK
eukprot:TRINITY_DN56113_c0_g1_i1.p2 TRINITY_DN56113_c0_g1~~TRINITY_DN56113_c0_g1_i1.p2  ORF type:complete len:101 (-),score=40.22 TRINITY_DN56113_c0_g1_i1:225-527(-)